MSRSESFRPIVQFASACVGAALLALSIAGFDHLTRTRSATFEGETSFGCLCFLGVCFGALLTLAELNWSLFYFFFGFLRYRIGRAVVFTVAGIMIGLIGKNLDDQCNCKSYVILIIEGLACVGMAAVHVIAIFLLGNNTKPVVGPPHTGAAYEQPSVLPPSRSPVEQTSPMATTTATTSGSGGGGGSAVVVDAPEPKPVLRSSDDPNQPAWMNA